MIKAHIEIINEKGLHARASAKFVKCAAGFDAQTYVIKDETRVDALSIMGLLMLAAAQGTFIDIESEGPQAQDAINALVDLINNRFGEGV